MAGFGRPLDVLRIDVPPPEDDQILEPAGDEQLAIAQEAEVSGAEEGAVALADQTGAHHFPALLGAVPVALRDARSRDPDLAYTILGARASGGGVDDRDHVAFGGAAAADQPRRGPGSDRLGDFISSERLGVRREHDGRAARGIGGDEQRGLGQAVAGQERLGTEAGRGEGLGEAVERLGADGLGAAECDPPTAQVQPRALLRSRLLDTEVVGEVGPSADRRAGAADRLEPPQRPLEERDGGEERAGPAAVERLDHAADQTHVMEQRQPEDAATLGRRAEGGLDAGGVVQQVAVRDHHALRRRRGTRGVLEEGERFGRRAGVDPPAGQLVVLRALGGLLVGAEHRDALESRHAG